MKNKQQIETRKRVMDYKLKQQKQIAELKAMGEIVGDPAEDGRGNEDIYNPSNMPQAIATGPAGLQPRFQ